MSKAKLLAAAIGALFMFGCQSGEHRQFLRDRVQQLESLHTQLIQDYEAFLQESIAAGREISVVRARGTLEAANRTLPAELDTLTQQVEDFPAQELSALSDEILNALERREQEIEDVARQRQEAVRADHLTKQWGKVGKSMRESIRREAQEGPAWLRTRPQQKENE